MDSIIAPRKGNPTWWSGGSIPDALSVAAWSLENKRIKQQTFLGASIQSFNVNGGLSSTSILNVSLIEDEFNKSDQSGLGSGDDVYHNGREDSFNPPMAGAPVFFKMGQTYASIEEAWRKTFDDIYGYSTIDPSPFLPDRISENLDDLEENEYVDLVNSSIRDNEYRVVNESALENWNGKGINHFSFGGILRNYRKSFNSENLEAISCVIEDPRAVLSGVSLVLKDWTSHNFGLSNLFNLYGFLEHELSPSTQSSIDNFYQNRFETSKIVDSNGSVRYTGSNNFNSFQTAALTDCYAQNDWIEQNLKSFGRFGMLSYIEQPFSPYLPITGKGYSRVREDGMPFYRIFQALNALTEINGTIPSEYHSYGRKINYKGFNYVLDLSEVPLSIIPISYRINSETITISDLLQEIADITNSNYFVSLLPVIDHPQCEYLYRLNNLAIQESRNNDIIAGIIKVGFITKNINYAPGSIKNFILNLENVGIEVSGKEYGVESTDVISDRVVVGGKENNIHFLRNIKNDVANSTKKSKLSFLDFDYHLNQSVMPYYGLINNEAISVPKGDGFFQQALLDSTMCQAVGVGDYYITTYAELEAVLNGKENWLEFLKTLNDPINTPDFGPIIKKGDVTQFSYELCDPRCLFSPPEQDSPYQNDNNYCFPMHGEFVYKGRYDVLSLDYLVKRRNTIVQNLIYDILNNVKSRTKVENNIRRMETTQKLVSEYNEAKNIQDKNNKYNELSNYLAKMIAQEGLVIDRDLDVNINEQGMENLDVVFNFLSSIANDSRNKFWVKIPQNANYRYNNDNPYEFYPYSNSVVPLFSDPFYFINSNESQYRGSALAPRYDYTKNDFVFNYSIATDGGWLSDNLLNDVLTNSELQKMDAIFRSPIFNTRLCPRDIRFLFNENNKINNYCVINKDFIKLNKKFLTSEEFQNNRMAINEEYMFSNRIPVRDPANEDVDGLSYNISPIIKAVEKHIKINDCVVDIDRIFKSMQVDERIMMPPSHGVEFRKSLRYSLDLTIQERQRKEKINDEEQTINYVDFDANAVLVGQTERNTDVHNYYLDIYSNRFKIQSSKETLDASHCYILVTLDLDNSPNDTMFVDHYFYYKNPNKINKLYDWGDKYTRIDINNNSTLVEDEILIDENARMGKTAGLGKILQLKRIPRIVPEVFAVALVSNERRYGPWSSNSIGANYYNVPGSVDYVIQEDLNPWSYAGYNLMNQAGILQAINYNNRNILIENGFFSLPSPPIGNSFMRQIQAGGPVVTDISTNVSEGLNIETTYNMNSFTPQFGKLQELINRDFDELSLKSRTALQSLVRGVPERDKAMIANLFNDWATVNGVRRAPRITEQKIADNKEKIAEFRRRQSARDIAEGKDEIETMNNRNAIAEERKSVAASSSHLSEGNEQQAPISDSPTEHYSG